MNIEQVKGKLGQVVKIRRLPFDVNVMLKLSKVKVSKNVKRERGQCPAILTKQVGQ